MLKRFGPAVISILLFTVLVFAQDKPKLRARTTFALQKYEAKLKRMEAARDRELAVVKKKADVASSQIQTRHAGVVAIEKAALLHALAAHLKRALTDSDLDQANAIKAAIDRYRAGDAPGEQSTPPVEAPETVVFNVEPPPITEVPAGQILTLKVGQTVDLLKVIDPAQHDLSGTWTKTASGLTAVTGDGPHRAARLRIPFAARGSYELTVDFTRTAGDQDIYVMLTAGQRDAGIALCSHKNSTNGAVAALEMINGRDGMNNPTTRPRFTLTNNVKHRWVTRVIVAGTKVSVLSTLNGKSLINWTGPQTALALRPGWALKGDKSLGLGTYQSSVTFHAVRLRVINGEAGWLK